MKNKEIANVLRDYYKNLHPSKKTGINVIILSCILMIVVAALYFLAWIATLIFPILTNITIVSEMVLCVTTFCAVINLQNAEYTDDLNYAQQNYYPIIANALLSVINNIYLIVGVVQPKRIVDIIGTDYKAMPFT